MPAIGELVDIDIIYKLYFDNANIVYLNRRGIRREIRRT